MVLGSRRALATPSSRPLKLRNVAVLYLVIESVELVGSTWRDLPGPVLVAVILAFVHHLDHFRSRDQPRATGPQLKPSSKSFCLKPRLRDFYAFSTVFLEPSSEEGDMDSIDVGGKWWLEDMDEEDELVPEGAVAGALTYSPEHGVELELLGSFYRMFERHDDDATEDGSVNIFGVTTEGEYVTILNCMYSGDSMSTKDISFTTESYEKGTVIRRGLVDTDSKYWKCSFSFNNLATWTGIRRVTTPGDHDIGIGPAVTESLSTDDADIILNMHEDMSSAFDGRLGRVYFTVYPDEPLTYNEYLSNYVRPLQNLVTLGVGEAVFPTFLNLYSARFGHHDSKHSAHWDVPYYREQDDTNSLQMNFTLQDIEFADVVKQ